MKVKYTVIVFFACLATTLSAPASEDKNTEKVGVVPLERDHQVTLDDIEKETGYGSQPVDDTGFFGYGNPLEGLLQTFENMMNEMRRQMESLFGAAAANGTEIDIFEPFPQVPFGPNIDLSKGNTTSVTKVIDGHKVVINETEYKDEGENGGAYFKVRIIDVKPDSSELTTEKDAEGVTRDTESMENSRENEIPKTKEIEMPLASRYVDNFGGLEVVPYGRPQYAESFNYWDDLEPLYPVGNNYIDTPDRPYDLSHDTDVNTILAQSGAPINPDAEFISINDQDQRPFERLITTRR